MHIEFFNQPANLTRDHVMVIQNGEYRLLRELNEGTMKILYLRLLESEQARDKLRILERYGICKPKDQIRQFAICNFGKLDHVDDLDEDGQLHFEFVKCSRRNHGCPFNSEICIRKY